MPVSPWKKHIATWSGCTKCGLSETRSRVVLARGSLPCDVLFVGEAPGKSEDSLGQPFVGPAGQLLDRIIEKAVDATGVILRVAWTNLVACLPTEGDNRKIGQPFPEEIKACRGRLLEFLGIARPKLIVYVGLLSERYRLSEKESSPFKGSRLLTTGIVHPASILRADAVRQEMEVRRTVAKLSEAFTDLVTPTTVSKFDNDQIPF